MRMVSESFVTNMNESFVTNMNESFVTIPILSD